MTSCTSIGPGETMTEIFWGKSESQRELESIFVVSEVSLILLAFTVNLDHINLVANVQKLYHTYAVLSTLITVKLHI